MTKKQKIEELLIEAVKNNNSNLSDVISENSHAVKTSQIDDGCNAKVVNFNREKRKYNLRVNVLEWTNRDFAIYMKIKYKEKYKEDWQLNVINITLYFDKIKDEVLKIYGHCDNVIMRDYINFFFSRWSNYFKNKSKDKILYKKAFKNHEPLKDFVNCHDYKASIQKILKKDKKDNSQKEINDEMMEKSYLLGDSNFILEYGLILTVNWLIVKRAYDIKKAVNYVANAFYKLHKKHISQYALNNTKKYEPYPDWFLFKKYNIILQVLNEKVKSNMSLSINFVKDIKKFNFLRRSI